ncbi:hypothetical protein PV703_32370 [Streptomyces sp. ME01-24h]|nr:hypothetical protein [Streptomyces sp. ME19-03-3]MDX3357902.1 hypothetical protein [Streptomyces sp. ME01-24h]
MITGRDTVPLSNIPRRRAVRAALVLPAAAGLLGGCSDGTRPGGTSAKGSPSVDAGVALRGRAARDSAALLARYDATIAAHPDLARRLQPLRAEVALHAEAFGASAPASPSTGPSPSVSPSVPTRPAEALSALVAAERALADARVAALRDAPAELARLLASVAACGAGHVLLLKEH